MRTHTYGEYLALLPTLPERVAADADHTFGAAINYARGRCDEAAGHAASPAPPYSAADFAATYTIWHIDGMGLTLFNGWDDWSMEITRVRGAEILARYAAKEDDDA